MPHRPHYAGAHSTPHRTNYATLHYTIHYTTPHYLTPHYITPHRTKVCDNTTLHYTWLYCTLPHNAHRVTLYNALHHTTSYHITPLQTPYYTTLHYPHHLTLQLTKLCRITLHHMLNSYEKALDDYFLVVVFTLLLSILLVLQFLC